MIAPEANAAFVANMEDVLEVYQMRCHANLNLRREDRKFQLGLMLPSRLATSGTRRL